MIHSADQQQEIDRLTELNRRLANQLVGMSDKLDESRRELLAAGWDAAATATTLNYSIAVGQKLKDTNPYRKPVGI